MPCLPIAGQNQFVASELKRMSSHRSFSELEEGEIICLPEVDGLILDAD